MGLAIAVGVAVWLRALALLVDRKLAAFPGPGRLPIVARAGAAREDPRPAAAEALRLNPTQPEAIEAVHAFRTKSQAAWERRARRLPLYLR